MITDPIGNRRSEGFPTSDPLQALEKDHNFVKKLFERYFSTQDQQVKQEAGPEILQLLEMHSSLEEATFYPAVQQLDARLVEECMSEHEQADQLIHQLKGMDPSNPQCDAMFQQLRDAILQHIDAEEKQLFPVVRQSNMDLEALGIQMQAYESNMVATLARESQGAPSSRRGS
ncbi:hemerythrin HHE cation binding domain-containing protein [Paucimonas lemoignei]|uniref:Hemerythrin HHE cation binding domain-containing protein n=2 Tax=Paucimonas lemoignei TaxID=29443 RepID=A0A4R3HZT2_PAULE|nr:hemerythrin HHE cation binding domain-containing protein [Paucimonas lemoignei]